ncbi:MAG: hypothetical protein JNL11_13515 [Bdellovibrionaceae bacterium]|nr:hypothetical protein [Pseudobdellovibrionaceae bacterium]
MLKKNKPIWVFVAICFLFLGLRFAYWMKITEEPFSDMYDYFKIATILYDNLAFKIEGFWQSYKPPTFPILISFYFFIRQSFDLDIWAPFQVSIHFLSLLILFRYLYNDDRLRRYFLFMFGLVAVSLSSVFWSFKLSTEYFSEIFIVVLTWCYLNLHRKPSIKWTILSGFLTMAAIFHRPQFLMVTSIPIVILLLSWPLKKSALKNLAILGITMFLVWLPWGLRAKELYGKFLFTSTQGPYSFLWELGEMKSVDSAEKTTIDKLQDSATRMFANDYQAMEYANQHVKLWIKDNWSEYIFEVIPRRIAYSLVSTDEGLTKVDRNTLFYSDLDKLILNKHWWFIALGVLGFLIGGFRDARVWILAGPSLLLWLFGCLFLSYPRILDPSIPYLMSGSFFLFSTGYDFWMKRRAASKDQ